MMSIVFKIMNMSLIIGFIIYAIKKYIMPELYHGFKHEREELKKMRESVEEHKRVHTDFSTALAEQKDTIVRLQKSIEQWRDITQEQAQRKREHARTRIMEMRKRAEELVEMRARNEVFKRSMNLALKRAEKTLKEQFVHNDKAGKAYNECVIAHVQKK